jgi:hypothetical protein
MPGVSFATKILIDKIFLLDFHSSRNLTSNMVAKKPSILLAGRCYPYGLAHRFKNAFISAAASEQRLQQSQPIWVKN